MKHSRKDAKRQSRFGLGGIVLLLFFNSISVLAADPPPGATDSELAGLTAQQQKTQDAIGRINELNPFSSNYKRSPSPSSSPHAISGSLDSIVKIEKILSNPIVQKSLQFFASPELTQAITQIETSPNKLNILYAQGGWILFMLVFKAWRRSKLQSSSWIRSIWLNLWTFAFFLFGSIIIIPSFFLGGAYSKLINHLLQSMMN